MPGISLEEAQRLITEALKPVQESNTRLMEINMRHEAAAEAGRVLETITLPATAKVRITERATVSIPKTAEGAFDVARFREVLVAEAKAEGEYLGGIMGAGRVIGMGGAPIQQPKPEEIAAREAAAKRENESAVDVFESIMGNKEAAQFAARGRAA